MNKYYVTIKNTITGETKEVLIQADSEFAAAHEAVNVQLAHAFEWESIGVRQPWDSELNGEYEHAEDYFQ